MMTKVVNGLKDSEDDEIVRGNENDDDADAVGGTWVDKDVDNDGGLTGDKILAIIFETNNSKRQFMIGKN